MSATSMTVHLHTDEAVQALQLLALAAIERLLQVAARINREGKPNLAAVDGPASAPGASARRAA